MTSEPEIAEQPLAVEGASADHDDEKDHGDEARCEEARLEVDGKVGATEAAEGAAAKAERDIEEAAAAPKLPEVFAEFGGAGSVLDSLDLELEHMQGGRERSVTPPRMPPPEPRGSGKKDKAGKPCKGCAKKTANGSFAPNSPYCWPCKRALDSISKMAQRQGPEKVAFLHEQRRDELKVQRLIANYNLHLRPDMEHQNGKKKSTFVLAKYVEIVKASSGVIRDKEGEFMWQKLYMEFASTVRGGRLSDEAALATWLQWEQDVKAKNPDVLWDYCGPRNELRIWVKTADKLRYSSSYSHEKNMMMEGKVVKKPNEEAMDTMRSAVLSNHVKHGTDFGAVATAMARNGESVFEGSDGFMLDVSELAGSDEETEAAGSEKDGKTQDEQRGSSSSGGRSEDTGEPTPKKIKIEPQHWIDRDRLVSSAVRVATSKNKKFISEAEAALKKHLEIRPKLEAMPADFNNLYGGELATLKTRLEALALVLSKRDDGTKLKEFIARFSVCRGEDASSAVELGRSPPIDAFADLRLADTLLDKVEDYHKCTQPAHLKDPVDTT